LGYHQTINKNLYYQDITREMERRK